MEYIKRVADDALPFRIESTGCLLISGPKWCGKSTTAKRFAKTVVMMQDPKMGRQFRQMADADPSLLLKGDTPLLVDEWQVAPELWDAIRNELDNRNELGQFLLTGSSVPPDRGRIMHSGAGRFSRFVMRPMSLFESGESNGEVSLSAMFDGYDGISGRSDMGLPEYAEAICRGGWPQTIGRDIRVGLRLVRSFCEQLVESDMEKMLHVAHDPERVRKLLRAYARVVSTPAQTPAILKAMRDADDGTVGRNTIHDYLNALRSLFIIEELPCWHPDFRSRVTLMTTDKRHFVDPSIGCAFLSLSPKNVLDDLNGMGCLFESLAVRDLRVYAEALEGRVFQYRDKSGLEADAVVHLDDGRYALFEMKLFSEDNIEEGARHLKAITANLDMSKMRGGPSFLAVVTGTNFAYRRTDGVYVIPLSCLRP